MPIHLDSKKGVAIKLLWEKFNIKPVELTRFTTGNTHSVYYVKADSAEYVLRVTSEENRKYYFNSLKWLDKLAKLEIPVPKILNHGQYEDTYYVLMTFIQGKDLGEIYHTLSDSQKHKIAKDLCEIQRKVATLPSDKLYGYDNQRFATWSDELHRLIDRSRMRITMNTVFDAKICDEVAEIMNDLNYYFISVKPIAFLDDITTKNVLIHNGTLAGIVDIDWICHGDPLQTIGLTNMALLFMGADTKYIDYWLDEINADDAQRKALVFYTLLFCIDFMGEQGMKFGNDSVVEINQDKVERLNLIYKNLIATIQRSSCDSLSKVDGNLGTGLELRDIPEFDTFAKIEPLNKGWSGDRKYYIEATNGAKLLLRISDISELERKKNEYNMLSRAAKLDIHLSVPVNFGLCNGGKNVYQLLQWVDGDDLESVLHTLSETEQYKLGVKAGKLLRKIHTLPAPEDAMPWDDWFYSKVQDRINFYKANPIKSEQGDLIIQYLQKNKHLLAGRPQTFNHGDYNKTNLIVMPCGQVGVIDFNYYNRDHGDPWWEFDPVNWGGKINSYFFTGQLKGYFDGEPPHDFFRMFAYYLAYDALAALCDTSENNQGEPEEGIRHMENILEWFDNMQCTIPTWYLKNL